VVRYHPIPDLPNHLAAVSVWHHYTDPRWDFQRYYALQLGAAPYWGYYLLTHLLAFPLGLDAANRVMLSLYVVGLPVGFALLARQLGKSPWLGLFAVPLVWNFNFAIGFVPFCIGLALVPYALVLFDRFCEQPTRARGALAALAGTVVYFGHLLPWGLFVACAGMIGLCHEGRRRPRVWVWLGATLPGLVLLLRGASFGLRPGDGVSWKGRPFLESLREFPAYVLDVSAWREDELMALVLLVAFLGLRLTAPREAPRPSRLHGLRAEACVLVALVAYFVLPRSVLTPTYWWGVNVRFAAPAVLFATLCVPGPIAGRRRGWLVPVALCGLGFAVATTVHWKRAARGPVLRRLRGAGEPARGRRPRAGPRPPAAARAVDAAGLWTELRRALPGLPGRLHAHQLRPRVPPHL
jgi:hypothetical protein